MDTFFQMMPSLLKSVKSHTQSFGSKVVKLNKKNIEKYKFQQIINLIYYLNQRKKNELTF